MSDKTSVENTAGSVFKNLILTEAILTKVQPIHKLLPLNDALEMRSSSSCLNVRDCNSSLGATTKCKFTLLVSLTSFY